ncbi:hypothetical protein BU15DRAFT_63783 [Melanogaster broomeanus]|nr:hypothetical protein BU15DRAFT_63783 [Melanogaster broomeanus]
MGIPTSKPPERGRASEPRQPGFRILNEGGMKKSQASYDGHATPSPKASLHIIEISQARIPWCDQGDGREASWEFAQREDATYVLIMDASKVEVTNNRRACTAPGVHKVLETAILSYRTKEITSRVLNPSSRNNWLEYLQESFDVRRADPGDEVTGSMGSSDDGQDLNIRKMGVISSGLGGLECQKPNGRHGQQARKITTFPGLKLKWKRQVDGVESPEGQRTAIQTRDLEALKKRNILGNLTERDLEVVRVGYEGVEVIIDFEGSQRGWKPQCSRSRIPTHRELKSPKIGEWGRCRTEKGKMLTIGSTPAETLTQLSCTLFGSKGKNGSKDSMSAHKVSSAGSKKALLQVAKRKSEQHTTAVHPFAVWWFEGVGSRKRFPEQISYRRSNMDFVLDEAHPRKVTIPLEVICHILCFMSPREIVRARRISKQLHDVTYDSEIWKTVYANWSTRLPLPAGPFPSQSTRFLEHTLVQSERLAQTWTSQPVKTISRVPDRLNQMYYPRLHLLWTVVLGRWFIWHQIYYGREILKYSVFLHSLPHLRVDNDFTLCCTANSRPPGDKFIGQRVLSVPCVGHAHPNLSQATQFQLEIGHMQEQSTLSLLRPVQIVVTESHILALYRWDGPSGDHIIFQAFVVADSPHPAGNGLCDLRLTHEASMKRFLPRAAPLAQLSV